MNFSSLLRWSDSVSRVSTDLYSIRTFSVIEGILPDVNIWTLFRSSGFSELYVLTMLLHFFICITMVVWYVFG